MITFDNNIDLCTYIDRMKNTRNSGGMDSELSLMCFFRILSAYHSGMICILQTICIVVHVLTEDGVGVPGIHSSCCL